MDQQTPAPEQAPEQSSGVTIDPNVKVFQSSHIQAAQYDPYTSTMRLTFTSGATYVYTSLSAVTWKGLRDAVSPGTYFTENIKSNPDIQCYQQHQRQTKTDQ